MSDAVVEALEEIEETPVVDAAPPAAEVVQVPPVPQVPAGPVAPPPMTDPSLARLQEWTVVAYQVAKLAQSLSNTQFVPKAMQKKPAEVTAAILTGAELGLDPMAAIRSIVVIQGTPTLTAVAMRALVVRAGHRIRVIEADGEHAIVHGWREGEFDGPPHVSEWTLERAKKLGLLRKDTWQSMPQNMLIARATSEACRLTAPDALTTVPYSTEEMADKFDVDLEHPAKRAHTKKRQAPAIPTPEALPPGVNEADLDAAETEDEARAS
jgi:hypothetical protein